MAGNLSEKGQPYMAATRTRRQPRMAAIKTQKNEEKDIYDRDPDGDAAVGRSGDVCFWANALSVG